MGSRGGRKHHHVQRWCPQPLTPLMEGPDLGMEDEDGNKKESSWEIIREWFRLQRNANAGGDSSSSMYNIPPAKHQDLRLLLGVLGCPLAPIPIPISDSNSINTPHIRDIPLVSKSLSPPPYLLQYYFFLIYL